MTRAHPFQPFLDVQGFVLLDGGLATALEARGEDLDDPLWSARVLLERPDAVRAVHADYLEAGADCIATVTYQATFPGFAARGVTAPRAEEAFRRAVALAVEARDAFWARAANRKGRIRPLVAASVGPYGAYLADGSEYTGRYGVGEEELHDWHGDRLRLLAASGADVLGCETIPSLAEARALVRLLGETPGTWAWIGFQCRDEAHLADGTPVEEAAAVCAGAPGVMAVGVNCVPPERVDGLLDRLRRGTDLPLVAYPNSGEIYDAVTKRWAPGATGPDPAASAPGWVRRGARVVGGCCRTGPDTILAMRRALLSPS
ncbi:MAG: homocysteine S-methyltransferase [Gemmatimonadota bacterium]